MLWCLGLGLGLSACSPTYNWRTWSGASTPLQAVVPCKPDVAQREVVMGDAVAQLHMHSCDNDGLRFVLAWLVVPNTFEAQQIMSHWQKASAQSLKAQSAPQAMGRPSVPGATSTAWWLMNGLDHKGQAVQNQSVYFSDGRLVYQAAIYGQRWNEEALAPFWEGLKLP